MCRLQQADVNRWDSDVEYEKRRADEIGKIIFPVFKLFVIEVIRTQLR